MNFKSRNFKTIKEACNIVCPVRFNMGGRCLTTSCMFWRWKDPTLDPNSDIVKYETCVIEDHEVEEIKQRFKNMEPYYKVKRIAGVHYLYILRNEIDISRIVCNYDHEKRLGFCSKV